MHQFSPHVYVRLQHGRQNVPLAVKMAQMIVAVGAADKNTIGGLEANPTMQAVLEDVQVQ